MLSQRRHPPHLSSADGRLSPCLRSRCAPSKTACRRLHSQHLQRHQGTLGAHCLSTARALPAALWLSPSLPLAPPYTCCRSRLQAQLAPPPHPTLHPPAAGRAVQLPGLRGGALLAAGRGGAVAGGLRAAAGLRAAPQPALCGPPGVGRRSPGKGCTRAKGAAGTLEAAAVAKGAPPYNLLLHLWPPGIVWFCLHSPCVLYVCLLAP